MPKWVSTLMLHYPRVVSQLLADVFMDAGDGIVRRVKSPTLIEARGIRIHAVESTGNTKFEAWRCGKMF